MSLGPMRSAKILGTPAMSEGGYEDFAKFQAAGAKVVREPYGLGDSPGWIATFADPDDNYFQLVSPM